MIEMPSDYGTKQSGEYETYYSAEINELGMRALQVYQRQHEIADRLWVYFNQYSGLIVLLALGAVAFRQEAAIAEMPVVFVAIPPLAYILFLVGNHSALRLTLDELTLLRNVAIATTRLRLRTGKAGLVLLFHLLMALTALVIYLLA
jgi:hypothetical protein